MKSERQQERSKLAFLGSAQRGLMYDAEGARSIWEPPLPPSRRSKARSDAEALNLPYSKK